MHHQHHPIRLRFAPSPTGGLHLGGVRTIIYNALFAQQHGGQLILRIEDTDQKRYVEGAEEYIIACMEWLGITFNEGPHIGGQYGPYRQQERQAIYQQYIHPLVDNGYAYYAFDTPEALDRLRQGNSGSTQYDHTTRMQMTNSLSIGLDKAKQMIADGVPYVVRIKMPEQQTLIFKDLLRGDIAFDTAVIDDKVLMKADGLPTYHFAVVVDDYLMNITHVFRGEEWLPSAPVHHLLWHYLGWADAMPQWIHLPLILKPDGNGKLSKRDGQRLGIPVFPLTWKDPITQDINEGFREKGFLPEAVINFLTLIAWHDTSGQELFTHNELVQHFNLERVHHHGAKFDYEKALWFNHQYLQKADPQRLLTLLKNDLSRRQIVSPYTDEQLLNIIHLTTDRCNVINDYYDKNTYLFKAPETYDSEPIKPKLTLQLKALLTELTDQLARATDFSATAIQTLITQFCNQHHIKMADVQLPLRIFIVGGKFGISVHQILSCIGQTESVKRLRFALNTFF